VTGNSESVDSLPNNGDGLSVTFPAKTITWVQFTVTDTDACSNIGLAEIKAYGPCGGVPPDITSPNHTTFTVGVPGTFTVTTTGSPPITITKSGTLPTGVNFVDNNNGTATLSGTPAAGTEGIYLLTFTATNAFGSDVQNFTLTVVSDCEVTPYSTPTCSSQNPATGQTCVKAIDGVVDGYPGDYTKEWATQGSVMGPGSD